MIDFLLNATIVQGELFKAKQGQEFWCLKAIAILFLPQLKPSHGNKNK